MDLETTYRCPGEDYEISRSIHLSRLAGFYRACADCPHRIDTALFATRRARQLHGFHADTTLSEPLVRAEGFAGTYLNQIGPQLAEGIGRAFGLHVDSLAVEADAPGAPRVFIAHDGRPQSAELSDTAIDGLRWAGCDVADLGAATAPCLASAAGAAAADGFVLAAALSQESQEVGFSFWRRGGEPLSGAGLAPIERLLHSSAPRRRRSSGGYQRVAVSGKYLSQFNDHYHALRPLRLVVKAHSLGLRGFVQELTANVAVEIDWLRSGSTGVERVSARVRATQAHFGVSIDGLGESCRVIDERGELLSIDALLALLLAEVRATQQGAISHRIQGPTSRQATWRSLRDVEHAIAIDDEGRIWFTAPLPCPDALKALSLLLTLLSRSDRPLSELAQSAIL